MVSLILLGGLFLGSIVFTFTFIAFKKIAKYYMAPIITFSFLSHFPCTVLSWLVVLKAWATSLSLSGSSLPVSSVHSCCLDYHVGANQKNLVKMIS